LINSDPPPENQKYLRILLANCIAAVVLLHSGATASNGDELLTEKQLTDERPQQVGESIKIANGSMVVVRQPNAAKSSNQIMIHFHGATETTRRALARSQYRGTLVIVNFPGLSSAYSKPFIDNPKLVQTIIQHATETDKDTTQTQPPRIILSSFSAGYGAIREILKSPESFERIEAIVTADSIYAGLDTETPARVVSREDMPEFLRFAELAAKGKKQFVLSHSAQTTPYASTTETADYLLETLQITRVADSTTQRPLFTLTSKAQQGKFTVLGFSGETGQHHMQHLHQIDLLWSSLDGFE